MSAAAEFSEIPQRELRNEVSRVLRDVKAGRSYTITVDGSPVADLVPHTHNRRRTSVPRSEILAAFGNSTSRVTSADLDPHIDDSLYDPYDRAYRRGPFRSECRRMTTASRGLIDTNVLILINRLVPEELPEEISVCAVTMAELAAGPHFTEDPIERAERIERLQNAEAHFDPLPFDTAASRRYGHVVAAVLSSGRNPRPRRIDLMIAAIASAHRLPLYTVNPKDFRGLDGLVTVIAVTHPDGR